MSAYLMPHPPVLIHEIGQGRESQAKATLLAMEEIAMDIRKKKPSTIIVITPHGPLFSDAHSIHMEEAIRGDFGQFGHKELSYSFRNNLKLTYQIVKNSLEDGITLAQMTREMYGSYGLEAKIDHGVLVPLHFVDKHYRDFEVIPITYGLLSPLELHRFGKAIDKAIGQQEGDVCVIASGDLSHKLKDSGPYSYAEEGPEFDKKVMDAIKRADLAEIGSFPMDLAEKAGECGLRSLMILVGILSGYEVNTEVLSYEGPFGVGYGTAILTPLGRGGTDLEVEIEKKQGALIQRRRKEEDYHVKLARMSLESYIRKGEYLKIPGETPKDLLQSSYPVFVSIKKNGSLRGCIGSTVAQKTNLAQEIIHFSIQAGTRDPRFPAVDESELDSLVYSVDVILPPEPVDDYASLDPQEFGVIVRRGHKSGLLLPRIEGVDTVEEQLRIALNKAGIGPSEEYSIERFKVIRHQ